MGHASRESRLSSPESATYSISIANANILTESAYGERYEGDGYQTAAVEKFPSSPLSSWPTTAGTSTARSSHIDRVDNIGSTNDDELPPPYSGRRV